MKLHEHDRVRPSIAGFTSPAQQAEMQSLLAGKWPALKPLPVFKFETDEYRAAMDFDKTRGEWVCRKTFLPSNKVQELRGALTEITMALPHGPAQAFAECAAAEQPEQELQKDASRRLQAILEWKEHFENGALYSGLQDYLSESQQNEIADSIRLTLTARQLQFSPKNVAYVFDALSKAGGKLATLVEIAQRNKTEQTAEAPAKAQAAAAGADFHVPVPAILPMRDRRPAALERPEELIGSVFPERDQPSPPALMALAASPASKIVTPEILDVHPSQFVEDLQEKVRQHAPVAGFAPQARTRRVASSAQCIENSPSRSHVLEISGFQVAAVVFLFAVLSLAVGLTLGRAPLGKRLRDTQKSMPVVAATSPAMLNRADEATSQTSTPPAANTFLTPALNPPAPATAGSPSESPSVQSLSTPPKDSANLEASPERQGSTELIARIAPPPAISQPAQSPRTVGPQSGASPNPAPRRVTPATHAAPHLSSPSTILVTGPGDGSKPFKLILPEKTIAASSSFAMTSQLSVLVPPAHGPAPAHQPARLQAGELVSFVWPRYPRPGDRYASSETVKLRTTIGKLGQVLDIKLLSGSTSLLPAATSAIRLWRYQPTLLNKNPVQAQQDVTIEFRPPQYLSRLSTPHPAHN